MWYNLLYIELKIKIEGKKYHHIIFIENVIKEELLWDKRNKEPNDIKKIMAEIIRRNLLNEENPSEYKKGITYVTLDLLDYYSELATKVVLDQIYFYDKFHPELFIKKGLFQNFEENNGNISEFIIPLEINVNIEGINYNDNLNWDLLDIETLNLYPKHSQKILLRMKIYQINLYFLLLTKYEKGYIIMFSIYSKIS